MASRKIQTYQNKANNLYTVYFVFDLDGKCKFTQTVYWILAASKGWIKQTYRKIMHTQNTQYTLYNIHKITSLETI